MDYRFLLPFLILQATLVAALDRKEEDEGDVVNVGADPYQKIMASSWGINYNNVVRAYNCSNTAVCDTYAGGFTNQVYLAYGGVDFQEGAVGLTAVVSQKKVEGVTGTGRLYLHLDEPNFQAFAVVVIGDTGGDENWVEVNQLIANPPTGGHTLILTVGAEDNLDIGNVAYFTFYKAGGLPFV